MVGAKPVSFYVMVNTKESSNPSPITSEQTITWNDLRNSFLSLPPYIYFGGLMNCVFTATEKKKRWLQ